MKPLTDKAVRKYLERYAEPEATAGASLAAGGQTWAALLAIPAYGEGQSLFETLNSVPPCATGRVLVVIVINEGIDPPRWAREANTLSLDRIRGQGLEALDEHCSIGHHEGHDLVLIDRTGANALPAGQGVGLARKIAADFAVALWAHGGTATPWIHCSDADALLPGDYFDRPRHTAAAHTFDFRHECSAKDEDVAILEYEIYLRYAVLGLRAAGSPWAWHAIGSTLCIDARAYAQVRGFPRREAAEDFHLLTKLAKVGAVEPLRGAPIRLNGRVSERVPFGTGRAMQLARERARDAAPLLVPAPGVYASLAAWQRALADLASRTTRSVEQAAIRAAHQHQVDATALLAALDAIGARAATEKLLPNQGDLARPLNESFDALATLRLLHALRDQSQPEVPLAEAITSAPFLDPAVREAWDDREAVRGALINQERRSLR
ncbi:MAG: hypothetical protein QF570_00365 [Myxococcota bacterium]|nr:hypothetical protein [Myxococcota bacterium]